MKRRRNNVQAQPYIPFKTPCKQKRNPGEGVNEQRSNPASWPFRSRRARRWLSRASYLRTVAPLCSLPPGDTVAGQTTPFKWLMQIVNASGKCPVSGRRGPSRALRMVKSSRYDNMYEKKMRGEKIA